MSLRASNKSYMGKGDNRQKKETKKPKKEKAK